MFSKKTFKKNNKVDPKKDKDPLELLEPFQEVIDEAMDVDWGELESKQMYILAAFQPCRRYSREKKGQNF